MQVRKSDKRTDLQGIYSVDWIGAFFMFKKEAAEMDEKNMELTMEEFMDPVQNFGEMFCV